MADEKPTGLSERLRALERQAEQLQWELQQLKADLLAYDSKAARVPAAPAERLRTAAESRRRHLADLEFWLGGRGLLLLGVAAFVLAVGFFVKEAIERGWMGPTVRVLLGTGVGLAAVIAGERTRKFGYRVYGLWVSAGGFSAIYLSIWAAAVLYTLVPTTLAFALMLAVVAAAAVLGLLRDSQSFVTLAAIGGYLAPLLLRVEPTSNLFGLGYLGLISGAGLFVSYRAGWGGLAAVSALGGVGMASFSEGAPHLHGVYFVLIVSLALLVARRKQWPLLSLLTVVIGWLTYWAASASWGVTGLTFASYAAAKWLADLIAWVGVTDWAGEGAATADGSELGPTSRSVFSRLAGSEAREFSGYVVTLVPPWAFYVTALAGLGDSAYQSVQGEVGFALALTLGAIYLALSYLSPRGQGAARGIWRAVVGYAFWLVAPALLWSQLALVHALLIEGVALTAAGLWLGKLDARAAGLCAFVLAAMLYWVTVPGRPDVDAAFIGPWGISGLGVAVALAAWVFGGVFTRKATDSERGVQPVLLFVAAIMFLGWGSSEIQRFFELLGDDARWNLASDLSLSGFWLAYAAALLSVGFRLGHAPVRWAGLAMALIAAVKVFLYDLSQLEEFYRIVSFVLMALVALALSFRYQKLRSAKSPGPP